MIPGYFTTEEIKARFGWSRQQVSATAKREGWEAFKVGTSHLYAQEDILLYADARKRTRLLKMLGWNGKGLCRHDTWDIACDQCGAFGVYFGSIGRCENGHEITENG